MIRPAQYEHLLEHGQQFVVRVKDMLDTGEIFGEELYAAQQHAMGLICAELEWMQREVQGVKSKAWRMKEHMLHQVVSMPQQSYDSSCNPRVRVKV